MSENKAGRKTAIIVAVILGILAVLYLGGLLGQMMAGYQKWLAEDGITGNAIMTPISFSPIRCMAHAFTKDGLKSVLIIIIAAVAVVVYIKLHDKFSSKDHDERNFLRSKTGTYGTAGWMTQKEMKSVLEITTPEKAKGIILGQKNGSVICLPANTMLNKHLCVFGASGTMKSRAVVRPYLFQSLKRGDSVVVTDPKGELYNDTAELYRRKGYKVRVFNLINPEHSDSWNCMADLNGDTMMAQILTNVIISNTGKGKSDHFWDNGEGNLLKSLILYIDQDATRSPESKHLPAVYQMLTQNTERSLSAIFDKLPISHPAKAPYNLFAQASDTVRAGIVLGLGTRLQVLQNESIKSITSKSELDLSEPGKTKCAYYVILSDQESSTEFISSLFFSFLFIKLTRYADSTPDQRCKVPVNIVFEELNNVGQLDTYPRRLSVARSRAIQVCHVVQSLAQFKNRYPEEQWAEIVGNCDTQIMLGCTEEQTAEYFSARSGDMTVEVESTMTVKQTIALTQLTPQYRHSQGMGKRRLLTPDEVFRIPNKEMLIIIRGEKILQAQKFDYTGHPYAKRMIKTSIFDYRPQDKYLPPQIENEEPQIPDDEPIIAEPPSSSRKDREKRAEREKVRRKKPDTRRTAPDNHLGERTPPEDSSPALIESGNKPASDEALYQTETESPLKIGSRRGDDPLHQTETEKRLDTPPQGEDDSLYQTETQEPLDEHADYPEDAHNHTEIEINPDAVTESRPQSKEPALHQTEPETVPDADTKPISRRCPPDRNAKKPAQHQTEANQNQIVGDRRAKKQPPPAPDYQKLLDLFRKPTNKSPQQSNTEFREDITDETKSCPMDEGADEQRGKPVAGQTESKTPVSATSAQANPEPKKYTGPPLFGDAKPPNDF